MAGVTRGYGPHNAIFVPAGTMHGFDMLGQVLGMKRIDLYVEYDRPVTDRERDQLRELVRRAGADGGAEADEQERGQHGRGSNKTGAGGEDIHLQVPPGTVVRDAMTGEALGDLVETGQEMVLPAKVPPPLAETNAMPSGTVAVSALAVTVALVLL